MLVVSNLTKNYGTKSLLSNVNFTVNQGERIGLIGPNGCGKTTLLRIISGAESADSGSVRSFPSDLRIGYLPQGLVVDESETIQSYLDHKIGDIEKLAAQLEQLAGQISTNHEDVELIEAYESMLAQMNILASVSVHPPAVLDALGLGLFDLDTPVRHLSGGQKTRLALAGILLSNPQLLLLDEPTNHLDIDMLKWLEQWLSDYRGAALIVSHDRAFLDNSCTNILEVDPQTKKVRLYEGNYSDYLEQKQAELDKQWQSYSDQQVEISRLKEAAAHVRGLAQFRKGGKADSGDKFAKGFFANRGMETIGRAKHIERRIEKLLTEDHIDKPRQTWQMKIEFDGIAESARDVMVLENLVVGYDPLHPLLEKVSITLKANQRVALIGANGAGKSSLLKTIIGQIPPLAGSFRIGSNVKLGYMAQEQEILEPDDTPLTTLLKWMAQSETEVRSFLSKFLIKGDDVFTPVRSMSFGERARLMLACLVAQGCNFLILDEPINHLDIPARVRFEQALSDYEGTVLAVVHDRYFIQSYASHIWEITGSKIQVIQ
ncbi:MAG: ABC-F type ribosomal protection protein [Anaerolineae bacterium]|nr:ABC-F type ribosomal protection protein [Anaerolineae bacterium]